MKITILQMKIERGDFAANCDTLYRQLDQAMKDLPDVIVLPELWDIGFYPRPLKKYADQDGKRTFPILSRLARQYQVNLIAGSIANRIGPHIFNTSLAIGRQGELISTYHKTHLFSPAGENKDFTSGSLVSTYLIDGIRCATILCYDIRFPELCRQLTLDGIAILFVPAAWPSARVMHWNVLTQARAIENEIFVVAANGCGMLGKNLPLAGASCIIDPWGEILAKASDKEALLTANLNLAIQKQIRETIDVFTDRRPKLYRLS